MYQGEVQFIRKEDWFAELVTLLEECSTQAKTLYKVRPMEDKGETYAAWTKLEQVCPNSCDLKPLFP